MANERFRDWACIVYPDSAPDNWIDILNNKHLTFGVSPLHDADFNGNGDEKKPHWHLYLKFSGVKSQEQVKNITFQLNCTIPIHVDSPVGMVRYFIHMDNPEKHQYSIEDMQCFGGFDIFANECFKLGIANVNRIMCDIQDWIIANKVIEYEDLWSFSKDFPDWRYVLNMYNCHSINRLLNSSRNRSRNNATIL